MRTYRQLAGESGVVAYAIAARSIKVKFADGTVYTYTYASTGKERVEQMKLLAEAGAGLATFISQQVGADYAHRSPR